jgi:hypothetical protein
MKNGCYSMWDDTHLLEMKVEATYGTKMTQCQVKTKVCHVWTQDQEYTQKFLLRVVAHLVSQTHFSSILSKSRGWDFF